MFDKKFLFFFILILAAGTFLRLEALGWNKYIHGDVNTHKEVAESLAFYGNTRISHDLSKPYVYYSVKEKGGRVYEQYPLWPLLGALLIKITGNPDGYAALKIWSFIGGIITLILTYLLAAKIGGRPLGLLSLGLVSFSYLLIDFSGNGSLYSLQTAFYLLFAIFLLNLKKRSDNIFLGILMGVVIMLNYQAVSLIPVYLIFLFLILERNFLKTLKWSIQGLVFTILVCLPWALRNFLVFGNPFFSTVSSYFWQKMGVKKIITGDVITFDVTRKTYFEMIKRILFFWFPHNLYFINRKLFIFAPISYIFFLFSGIEVFFSRSWERHKSLWIIFLIMFFHTLLAAIVPIFHIRHFVPLLPFVFILAGYYIFNFIKKSVLKKLAAISFILALAVFSVLTYFSTPSHTYYYDGTITESIFGSSGGELKFLKTSTPAEYESL